MCGALSACDEESVGADGSTSADGGVEADASATGDAGSGDDAGARDAGAQDAGAIDAGVAGDAGSSSALDGATSTDAAILPDDGGGCPLGRIACDGVCVDPTSDPEHCGDCDTSCPAGTNAAPTCGVTGCGLACDTGFADCDATAGCETPLGTLTDCTGCGVTCDAPTGGSASCATGACVPSCSGGLTPCGGACVNTSFNASHCGACNNPCPTGPSGTPVCSPSGCGFTCTGGFGDCNAGAGCETALNTNANCGACGVPCTAPTGGTASCATGTCMPSCGGATLCGSECVDTTSSEAHCGTCGMACMNARTCTSSACNLLEILALINARRTAGTTCGGTAYPAVAALAHDATGRLDTAAQRHAADMATTGVVSFTGSDGSTVASRVTDTGYSYTSLYEAVIVAANGSSPAAVVDVAFGNESICIALMNATYLQWGGGAQVRTAAEPATYHAWYLARPS